MGSIIPVTAAVIRQNGQILIAQRKADAHQGQLWEFPGGKVQFGERPEEGLRREILEELGMAIWVDELFAVESHVYGDRHILLLVYLCTPEPGQQPKVIDVGDFAWVTPAEMNGYQFAPADVPIVAKLQGFVPAV
ncbi:MAG TPA: (deoxy)nucleoside triphosphate pyrophosphohydrolase [Symbiobacteriaceae bacterium]|nr:(deoxy)nucleoside triphosphate pyrophosphohydrolase [Symbiobacteriaceae bacterium]